ncbi:TPA: hypothetical protein ACH3X3_005685 [Trebouxia sp. C0006]
MLSANTVDFGHVCVGSCPSDSGSPCILCKHSTEPKCFSGSHFAQQQFEEQQLTTPCDMLPHINIKRLSEYNESVRVEVSVVNGKEYINKCPVPWQRSDSRKDMNMRLDHQQLHINKYNRKSRTWIQEPKNSMLVGGPEWESPAGGAVYRDIALQPGTQMFELEGFAIQYNGNQTPWRLMVRICLPDSNAIGDPSQYQELAVAVSEAFQANMVTPLPESQLALSSQLIDTEAATTADEFDPARSYLLDNHDPMFPSGGVSDDDDGHGMLFDDSRAAARSNLRLEANSLGPWLIAQNPAFPSVSPLVAQPSTDQEAGAEFTSTPHIHPCVSSEVLFDEQVSGSMPALGTPYASTVASLYEAWMQDPADSFDVPSHQGASLQQAMPPNHMDDDTSTDPHDIPSLENFHAGVPSTDEAQLADSAQQSAPVHRHASAKSNSRLSDDHMPLDSSPRKRSRKEMSHKKMLCLVCFLVFGLYGLLSDSPPTWFPSYSSKTGQAGLAHSFNAKQEHDRSKAGAKQAVNITSTLSPELEQHDQHQQAMWEESWAPMAPHKQAARKLLFAVSCLTTNLADKQKCSWFDVAAHPSWHGSLCLNETGCPACLWSVTCCSYVVQSL